MNAKFSTTMEEILVQIEDISKRLSRPVKDLDDVRTAMAALKEIREEEIRIDMSLGPIEVSTKHTHTASTTTCVCPYLCRSHMQC